MNRAKEKNKKKNTKEKNSLDLDNEIIIGIKTLPELETSKHKKAPNETKKINKKNKQREKQKKHNTVNKKNKNTKFKTNAKISNSSSKNNKRAVKKEDEIELRLGIEDEIIKKKNVKAKRKPKKTVKQEELARKKRKRIFRLIKWTTLIAVIIGGGIYFLLSPYFNIKSIVTTGNEKITSEELISLSGIQLEENMFKISSHKVEENIKTNSYIDSIHMKRKLPDTIQIQVKERKAAYMLLIGNAYMYLNTQGYLLEISKEALKLPIITGYVTPEEQIQEGNRLCAEDLERLNAVIQIMNSANSNEIGDKITKINIEDKQNYILELKSEKKTVHLGDISNLSTKMLYVKTVMEKEKKNEGEIFVNTDLNTKGAIFREKV